MRLREKAREEGRDFRFLLMCASCDQQWICAQVNWSSFYKINSTVRSGDTLIWKWKQCFCSHWKVVAKCQSQEWSRLHEQVKLNTEETSPCWSCTENQLKWALSFDHHNQKQDWWFSQYVVFSPTDWLFRAWENNKLNFYLLLFIVSFLIWHCRQFLSK